MKDKSFKWLRFFWTGVILMFIAMICGCEGGGYSNESLFDEQITSVYVEMFDNQSFYRDVEYGLTDAIAKRIEAGTPYKIVSDRSKADTVLSGYLKNISQSVYTTERETGRALEKEIGLYAIVNWKNLKSGKLLLDSESISASASYSEWQNQGFAYGSALASNKLAKKIVQAIEKQW